MKINKNGILIGMVFSVIIFGLLLKYQLLSLSVVCALIFAFFVLEKQQKQSIQPNKTILGVWISGILGLLFAVTILGTKILNPKYIDWLIAKGGDSSQHFLGWYFFEKENWHLPFGVIESLNTPVGTTITYMDSIPLLGFLFKLINFILPEPFQYLGWWILLCFILQGVFGYLLISRITPSLSLQIIGSMFFILSPIMLIRTGGHEALAGHWIILAALYVALHEIFKQRLWLLLLTISLLVHPYLFFMVYLIYVVKLFLLLVCKVYTWRMGFIYFVGSMAVVLIILWSIGYFYIGSIGALGELGYYSMNINSIVNPQGWSNGFIANRPNATNGQYEGFNYLGLGVLGLVLLSIVILLKNIVIIKAWKRFIPVFVICIVCTIFAISNVATFDQFTLFSIHLPGIIAKVFSIIRVSGRFFWPVYYCIIFFSLFIVIKKVKFNYLPLLLIVALVIQFIDLSGKYTEYHQSFTKEIRWESLLKSEVWSEIGQQYKHVVFIPAEGKYDNSYLSFAMFAAKNHMSINIAYVARDNIEKRESYKKNLLYEFNSGKWDKQTVYIVNESQSNTVVNHIMTQKDDIYFKLDGYNVLLPDGYSKILNSKNKEYALQNKINYPMYNYGDIIKFGENQNFLKYLGAGWGTIDKDGAWIEAETGELFAKVEKPKSNLVLKLTNLRYLSTQQHNKQDVSVFINGYLVEDVAINYQGYESNIIIPKEIISDELFSIKFILHDVKTPKELGINGDTRKLGLWIDSISITQQ
ncbi:DUF6311 domain-containing protein [Paenibacillus sp. 32352]|uniref:DUF6311 domain-containing protein n=1 Tax=Paenibacillus sp. 32352 TaxID=1969111 RepID=UPI0009AE68A8|nr:DUF6311 domain-containing protein [Paenibacillus sp. 32352]